MGERTTIGWTHHTFNAWIGCHKVSPACKHCYAEAFAKRTGKDVWGADKPRYFVGEDTWKKPLKWNREAEKVGERRRVFCGSMMDVLELHNDGVMRVEQDLARSRLWLLIEQTPHLDWLLLTKRPENAEECLPEDWWRDGCPDNVWFGTTVENQEYADVRIPHLLKVKARVLFLSCEPLLGPIDLHLRQRKRSNLSGHFYPGIEDEKDVFTSDCTHGCGAWMGPARSGGPKGSDPNDYNAAFRECPNNPRAPLHWIIAGGESGHHHREHQLEWSRSLRDQAKAAGVPFFFKQLGEHATEPAGFGEDYGRERLGGLTLRSKGESLLEIPMDLRVREFPVAA